jgi:hypothetical protein
MKGRGIRGGFWVFSVVSGQSIHEAFDDNAVLGSKVDEQAEFHGGGFGVVDDL